MAAISRFEDIKAWQKARILAKEVYKISSLGKLSTDFGLRDQMRRAAVSVAANIAEGFERQSNKELVRFLYIAKASCGELRSHAYIALDLDYIDQNTFKTVTNLSIETSRMLSSFITYLRNNENSSGVHEPEAEYLLDLPKTL